MTNLNELFTGHYAKTCQNFYLDWHIYLQEQLREWYQIFIPDLFQSPNFGRNELIDALRLIASAAEHQTQPVQAESVLDYINSLLQARPPQKLLSPEFRWMLVSAQTWANGDEILTQVEAALRLDIDVRRISDAARRGQLSAYIDPAEPNPQRRGRVLWSETRMVFDNKKIQDVP